LAVGLNYGTGSNSLNAGVKAFEKTPDGSWPESFVLRVEVEIMHRAGKMLRRFKLAFDERLVGDCLRRYARQFASLPLFHLLSHRGEVSLLLTSSNPTEE
jgi:hypothetical protein